LHRERRRARRAQTTYDEKVKIVSPATLMRHEVMNRLFDEGRITRIEFYGKAMEWHLRWTNDLRTLYHVNRYRWSVLKRLRSALWTCSTWSDGGSEPCCTQGGVIEVPGGLAPAGHASAVARIPRKASAMLARSSSSRS
jgi:hypothetical protein